MKYGVARLFCCNATSYVMEREGGRGKGMNIKRTDYRNSYTKGEETREDKECEDTNKLYLLSFWRTLY